MTGFTIHTVDIAVHCCRMLYSRAYDMAGVQLCAQCRKAVHLDAMLD